MDDGDTEFGKSHSSATPKTLNNRKRKQNEAELDSVKKQKMEKPGAVGQHSGDDNVEVLASVIISQSSSAADAKELNAKDAKASSPATITSKFRWLSKRALARQASNFDSHSSQLRFKINPQPTVLE